MMRGREIMASDQNKPWGVRLIVLIPLVIISLVFVGFISMKVYRIFNPYLDREISGPVTTSTEWLEIRLSKPLRPERHVQEIDVKFAEPYDYDHRTREIRFQDGSPLIVEVQLVDQYGNVFELNKVTALGRTGISRGMRDPSTWQEILPKDRTYQAVRIRSNKPIEVSKIIWRSYNPWDRK